MPLLNLPRSFQVDSSGKPYAAAKLYTFRAGTTTNLTVYATSALGSGASLPNPVVADSNGLFPAMYVDPNSGFDLRVQLKTSADVLIYDEDNIPRATTSFQASSFTDSVAISGNEPRLILTESDAGADLKKWDIDANGGVLKVRTRTDADGTGSDAVTITRTTTAITTMGYGNSVDKPGHTFYGNVTGDRIQFGKIKTTDTARSGVIALTDDPDLIIPLAASAQYEINVHLPFSDDWTSGTHPGIVAALSYTGTVTKYSVSVFGFINGSFVSQALLVNISSQFSQSVLTGSGLQDYIKFQGSIITNGAGNLSLKWCQFNNSGTTTVRAGALLTATKI